MQQSDQQRSCYIFVEEHIRSILKQRSCDILVFFNFNQTVVILSTGTMSIDYVTA